MKDMTIRFWMDNTKPQNNFSTQECKSQNKEFKLKKTNSSRRFKNTFNNNLTGINYKWGNKPHLLDTLLDWIAIIGVLLICSRLSTRLLVMVFAVLFSSVIL